MCASIGNAVGHGAQRKRCTFIFIGATPMDGTQGDSKQEEEEKGSPQTMLEDKKRLVRELSPLGEACARQCTREAQERKEKLVCKEARDLAWRRKPLWNLPTLGSPYVFRRFGRRRLRPEQEASV